MGDLVFVGVVLTRFLIPLGITRYPLPAIVASLVVDAADQTVFAAFDVEPDNYQSYDKALDIYYLTIAYVSTIRNWPSGIAFRVAQFLWYYRLVGVVAFELSGARALLLIFPNTFEYFFIAYEIVRLSWNPRRLGRDAVLALAGSIWLFIKLPQEWWIHIAKLDVTEFVADNDWVWPALGVVALVAAIGARRLMPRMPAAEWGPTSDVDAHETTVIAVAADRPVGARALLDHPLLEKTILMGFVCTIFVQLFPSNDTRLVGIVAGVGAIVVLNSLVGSRLAARGRSWAITGVSFVGTGVVNLIALLLIQVMPGGRDPGGFGGLLTFFLLALLTLIGTLYDRHRRQRIDSYEPVRSAQISTGL
ncbi:MAG: hypothetical protein GY925_26225 [Actinomycetia bacterium]|nr:hypothetical protein [Actinomycetes bacterium]